MGARGLVVCGLGFFCCFSRCVSLISKRYPANPVLGLRLWQVQRKVVWTPVMKSLVALRRRRFFDIFRAAKPRPKFNKIDTNYIKGNISREIRKVWKAEECS